MPPLLLCLAVASCCLTGCDQPKPVESPAARPVAPPPAAPPAAASPNAPPGAASEQDEPSIAVLNAALNAYTIGLLKEPATLEDLVKAGYLKRLPAPPPGKKFKLNAGKTSVSVVDQ